MPLSLRSRHPQTACRAFDMGKLPPPRQSEPERLRSQAWLKFFDRVMRARLRSSFNAVRLARPGAPAVSASWPLIVYCNHPSWWDAALVPVVLAEAFSRRRLYGPIDADALRRYGFMRRVGLFGIEPETYAGAAAFLRIGRRLLQRPDTLFCVTPQGAFVDTRVRPLRLQPGLAGLLSSVPRVTVLPLAVEYPFWGEPAPEALVRFGEPLIVGQALSGSLVDVQQVLEKRLAATMDRLAQDAIDREAGRFDTLLDGSRVGVGGVYDLWRRLKAWRRGEHFDPAHGQPARLPGDKGSSRETDRRVR